MMKCLSFILLLITIASGTSDRWNISAAYLAELVDFKKTFLIDGGTLRVDNVILHPGWEENNRPDLAHIKLDRSIQRIQPVPLYKRIDEIVKQMIIAGIGEYGTGKTGVEGNSGIMCAATNVVDSTKDDAYFLYREFDAPNSEKVTPLEGVAGPGDSARPAFIKEEDKYYLAGVGAGQNTQATGGIEGLYGGTEYYVKVSIFIDWIENTMSE